MVSPSRAHVPSSSEYFGRGVKQFWAPKVALVIVIPGKQHLAVHEQGPLLAEVNTEIVIVDRIAEPAGARIIQIGAAPDDQDSTVHEQGRRGPVVTVVLTVV